MSADPLIDEDEYASSEDSDFRPDDAEAAARESEGEDSDSETEPAKQAIPAKRKKDATADGIDDGDLDNSGDEALVEKARKRLKKKKGKDDARQQEEEGGEGGLVKTRSMRAAE